MHFKWWLYFAGMRIFTAGILISSLWNEKSRLWINGRKNWKKRLADHSTKRSFRIWFHVASLGEFEQARPVIEETKKRNDHIEIILTFFSPSGYEMKKNYSGARVFYLPPDLHGNAEKFITDLQPDLAVFTKYDLWPGYLRELLRRKIRTILISAYWTKDQKFASWKNPLNKSLLKQIDRVFLQKGSDLAYIRSLGFDNVNVAGDTRIDRSLHLPHETSRIPAGLQGSHYDLVAGSTWPHDEQLLLPVIRQLHLKAIIAPHDVSTGNINRLIRHLNVPFQLLSTLDLTADHQVLIVDSIGLLSTLYSLGDMSYVGGGFGEGIHNILEPAAHGKPVIFGPRYKRFREAIDLLTIEAAHSISDEENLRSIVLKFKNTETREHAGKKAINYLYEQAGATTTITNYIMEIIPSNQPV